MRRVHRRAVVRLGTIESLEQRRLLSGTPTVMAYVPDYKLAASVSNANWSALSQVNYFAALPDATPAYNGAATPEQNATSDGGLQTTSDSGYSVASQLSSLVGSAHNNGTHSAQVYVTVGAGDPAAIYDMDALVNSSPAVWQSFANNLKSFCNNQDLNGVDLDWEPSIQGFTVTATQIESFGKLVQTVHNTFASTGLLLSSDALGDPVAISTAAGVSTGSSAYLLDGVAVENLDAINVEAYPVGSAAEANTIMSQWASYVTGKSSSINPSGQDVAGQTVAGNVGTLQYGLDISADDASNTTAVVQQKVDTTISQGYGGLFLFDLGESSASGVLSTIAARVAADEVSNAGSISGAVHSTTGAPVSNETIYLDANNNGKLDSAELSTTTSSTGTYTFTNVPAGNYIVRQVLRSSVTQTSPASGYGIHLTVANGSSFANQNFTDNVPATAGTGQIAGSISTASGTGLANVTVYLDANNNSALDTGELSTTTNASGAYLFTNVPAGAYILRQILPAGDKQTAPTGGYGVHITVTSGGNLTGENFTDTLPSVGGNITGTIKSSSGSALAGITVYLDTNNNSTLDPGELSTTTNASGAYSFSDVPVGAYIIRQILPAGDRQTSPSDGYGIHLTVANGSDFTGENFTDSGSTNQPAILGKIVIDGGSLTFLTI